MGLGQLCGVQQVLGPALGSHQPPAAPGWGRRAGKLGKALRVLGIVAGHEPRWIRRQCHLALSGMLWPAGPGQ